MNHDLKQMMLLRSYLEKKTFNGFKSKEIYYSLNDQDIS
jgi:hypothetical protein